VSANPLIRQAIPTVIDDPEALIGEKSARQRLFDLFDATDQLVANVSLWERDDHEAATALVLWASDHRRPFRRNGGEFPSLEVTTQRGRSICVYLRLSGAG
jgi:hypothetical protein